MTTYDAIVVGAGPAGASAARALAAGGARVLLLEKARIPRYKPCGGGLTARALGGSPLVAGFPPETRAATIRLAYGPSEVSSSVPTAVHMVMRAQFDAFLTQQAAAAGAELRDGSALESLDLDGGVVRIRAGADTLQARYLIGADGANGVTARLAGFPPGTAAATAIEVEIETVPDQQARYQDAALFDFGALSGGYGWIFGKGAHLSAGVGAFGTGTGRELRPSLAGFLERQPALRGGKVVRQKGHRIPLAGSRTHYRRGPVLLAGDAAGLADPLTGEGICYALASGRRAGAGVLAALQSGPEALAGYDRYLQHTLGGDLRYARWIAWLAYRYPDLLLRVLTGRPGLLQMAVAAVGGDEEYRALAMRLLRGVPKVVRHIKIGGGA